MEYPVGYYVYRLIDSRDGLPFYVGKGQRGRAWTHVRDVRAGKATGNARKIARIEDILRFGCDVEVDIVAVYDLESDALDHEFRLVDENPTLTNVMPGGGGGALSAAAYARRRAIRAEKLKRLRQRERVAAMAAEAEIKRREYLAAVPSERGKAQVDKWLAGLDEKDAQRLLSPRGYRAQQAILAIEGRQPQGKRKRKRGRKHSAVNMLDHQTP